MTDSKTTTPAPAGEFPVLTPPTFSGKAEDWTAFSKRFEWYRQASGLATHSQPRQYTPITDSDVRELQSSYEDLLAKIRPNAVSLVDAFDFRDEVLCSALGAYDGRVYERLMEEALKSPLNAEPVNESFHKYLKPLMQGKLVPHKL